ncbi:sulfate adenylyltransferase subunit CysN [Pseudemcibacter aquimaris]|uniref:sulfate adenylyltransferase subunit CysN n=1 Tax=Pseudemcibacter aquimaris TaxID=2857064 RepID=UPI0020130E85|nr:sulfate adenylyltransferase subunit CysN [Pseudemcibacter aquimaris]MCC3861713.1 sulfate adenylyltransferase subunit CysN [Pseudemcibacter aquimaris]WDU58482.1 sulfate adenylyltransferase subunit CysN [Pseudemcibacter aquimaris]
MSHQSDLIEKDISAYLKSHEEKGFLRFITCGSVDDGKSTLIGRLLYDSKMIFEDQLSALENDSKKQGTQGQEIDFALLVDGLAAEREQGITIDVAYRFFSTETRKFIVADTPGHEQYTRNMATGASTADLAILMIDARKGILTQTRRHSFIVSLLGIKNVVLAINKMDLVGYDQNTFDQIEQDYRIFAEELGFESITSIPLSALMGDNILELSQNTPWYKGTTLLEFLETVEIHKQDNEKPFRFPVQWVNRPNLDFRGFSGTVAGGTINIGDEIIALPNAKTSKISRIIGANGDQDTAQCDEAITLCLEDEIDISRGDVIAKVNERPETTDQFQAHIIWMHEEQLLPGRPYLIKTNNKTTEGMISDLKHKVNVNTLDHESGKVLELNEVGLVNINLAEPIAFDPYAQNKSMGSFIIIDKFTNATVACGMINFGLRRASNVHWQAVDVDKETRAKQKRQQAKILWFTGLSGSGKSTIANLVEKKLHALGKHTYLLDGDNVRHGLNQDLGFTDADRVENIRRIGEVSKLMVDAGLIVLTAFISPFKAERRMVREMVQEGEFIEIFVDTPLEVCEQRDIKGLYKKARSGNLKNFTGIDSPYEIPETAEIHVNTVDYTADEAAEYIVGKLIT